MPQPPEDIENKFMTATKFAGEIEKLVSENADMNYIDAIIHFCEQNSIEVDSINKLVSKPLKEILEPLKEVRISLILSCLRRTLCGGQICSMISMYKSISVF